MANTLKLGAGKWATGKDTVLSFNDENGNFKPLPFSFSRASSATVVNQSGLIETVGSGEPRIDFLGNTKGALLLEPSRSNLITYSEEFDNSYWNKVSASATSGFVSPDGTNNAYKLVEDTSNAKHYIARNNLFTPDGITRDYSIFVKEGERRYIFITNVTTTNNDINSVVFDTRNGVFTNTNETTYILNRNVTTLTNGWYRIDFTSNINSGAYDNFYIGISSSETMSGVSYQGDGTSGIYIYGAQLEQGSYATSYIPTSGQSGGVTRVADACKQENLLTDIIDASYPFTLYVDGTYNGQLSILLSFLNKDASQQFFLIYIYNNEVLFSARSNGTIERIESGINLIDGQKYKIAVTMNSATSGKISVNGNSVVVKNNFSSQIQNSNITDLLIGQERIVSDDGLRSSVSGVKLYNTALTDQELIALTQ